MEYQMVIRIKGGRYYGFYLDAYAEPVYDFDTAFVIGKSVKEVLNKAKTIKPNGKILFTYIDSKE